MVKIFKEKEHPTFRSINALNRGYLKTVGGKCTIHFTAESPHAELLHRTIHSANPLNIYGAIANWCEELTQLVLGQSHLSMEKSVGTERSGVFRTDTEEAAGNRLRIYVERFEELSSEIQLTKACESEEFTKRVSIGMHYKNINDVDDGFESKIRACREYTKPREDPGSEVIAWINHTKIGPTLHGKTISDTGHIKRRIKMLGC